MSEKWLQSFGGRRSLLAKAVGIASVAAFSSRASVADAEEKLWRPARHAQDDWFDKIPGEHRFVFDTTSAEGMALALRFARTYFRINQAGYGLKDNDLAVVIIARHHSTAFAYSDALWSKYGKQLSEQSRFTDPQTKEPPKINLYAVPESEPESDDSPASIQTLIKRGAQFAVCQAASRAIAGRIAKATGGNVDAIFAEIGANLLPNARFVPAGIVAVNRAQELGYAFVGVV